MKFSEINEERIKTQEKNIDFKQQCKQMVEYIEKSNVKTLKRSNNNAKNIKTTRRK